MSSETTNTGGQPAEAEPFNVWLARRATEKGYDVQPGGGGRSQLARAADVSPAQIGRALEGQAAPSTDTLRALGQPLKVPFVEMLFRAGVLTVDDIFELVSEFQKAAARSTPSAKGLGIDLGELHAWPSESGPASPEEVADQWGIQDPEGRALIRAVYDRLASPPRAMPKRPSLRQRGLGGHPRPHEVKADEPEE